MTTLIPNADKSQSDALRADLVREEGATLEAVALDLALIAVLEDLEEVRRPAVADLLVKVCRAFSAWQGENPHVAAGAAVSAFLSESALAHLGDE